MDVVERRDVAGPVAAERHADVDRLEERLALGDRFGTGGRIALRLRVVGGVQPVDLFDVEDAVVLQEAVGAGLAVAVALLDALGLFPPVP